MTFSVFYLNKVFIRRGTFCWKPHLNWTSGSKVTAIERLSKQQKTKEMLSFFWLYLAINATDFRLILLDHNTYILILYLHVRKKTQESIRNTLTAYDWNNLQQISCFIKHMFTLILFTFRIRWIFFWQKCVHLYSRNKLRYCLKLFFSAALQQMVLTDIAPLCLFQLYHLHNAQARC